jgi:hypothetical protein
MPRFDFHRVGSILARSYAHSPSTLPSTPPDRIGASNLSASPTRPRALPPPGASNTSLGSATKTKELRRRCWSRVTASGLPKKPVKPKPVTAKKRKK